MINVKIYRYPLISIILVGLLCFVGCFFVSFYLGTPTPYIHDEFSYLLAGDTFAQGHITNPTHPMWMHFETFHVLQHPTYMSRYPPGQGFFLAIGKIFFGHPIFGVWLSNAFMCMAICWMLYGLVPAQWALIGGLVSVLQFGVFTYWSHSYWGGAVGALGGALVYGALPRIFKYQRLRDVCWLGLGIAVLANSRPLEGILIGIPVGCLVLSWKIRWGQAKNLNFVKKVVLPLFLLLLIMVIGVGSYNKAITGKAELFPHRLYAQTQESFPLFLWQDLRPIPLFNQSTMRNFENLVSNKYFLEKKSWAGFYKDLVDDIRRMFMFYLGYILSIPLLLFWPVLIRNRSRTYRAVFAIGIFILTCADMPVRAQTHYFSYLTGLAVFIVVLGLRALTCLKINNHRIPFSFIYFLMAIQLIINIVLSLQPVALVSFGRVLECHDIPSCNSCKREDVQAMLIKKGGKHLVLVKNVRDRFLFNDWVYNDANIDQSAIVWARDMDKVHNDKLLEYFKDRQVWRVIVDREYSSPKKYDQR